MDFPIFTLGGAKSLQGGAFLTIGFKKQAQGKKCSVLTDFPYSIQKHLVQYTIEIDELPLELMDVKSVGIKTNRNLSAYYTYNTLSCLCKIPIVNMPVILAIISVMENVHHTAFKPIK